MILARQTPCSAIRYRPSGNLWCWMICPTHTAGRIDGSRNEYVVGWIKRGPTGVIGSNKSDAQETVDTLVKDFAGAELADFGADHGEQLMQWLLERQPKVVTQQHWKAIDDYERAAGEPLGRPRVKVANVAELIRIGHG